jgi:carboxylate-amine ligase
VRDLLYELTRELAPMSERLGCADELAVVSDVLEQGNSCERQRAILTGGGTLDDMVDATLVELAEDRFVTTNLRTSNGAIGHAGT